jgi:DNA-binding Xre family transcriptional regulator
MNEFKTEALERLLAQHKDRLGKVACLSVRRTIEQGGEALDLNTLNKLCRDLECLPTDILRAV